MVCDELEGGIASPGFSCVPPRFRLMDKMTTGTARKIRRASSGTHELVGRSPPTKAAGSAGCVADVTDLEAVPPAAKYARSRRGRFRWRRTNASRSPRLPILKLTTGFSFVH